MSRNVNPGEGGPAGGQLEAKIGAFYFLSMLAEAEPRGMPGCTATKVKFQRTYEGHALDDIIVLGVDADGNDRVLEIQSKRTTDFTASDAAFGKTVAQIVGAGPDHTASIAIAIARTTAKIERHYQQLLLVARKASGPGALARALAAPRIVSKEMRDFAGAVRAQIIAAGGEGSDDAVWRLLRRLEILVFDFESVGALSAALADSLCHFVLPDGDAARHRDLWDALQAKALSYDADGGEITRAELVDWLRTERGLELKAGRALRIARRRFGDASEAALAAIDDTIAGIHIDRSNRVLAAADQLDTARFLEIVGRPGCGKSSTLKALAEREGIEGRPLVLAPARTPGGGWLALSAQLGFHGSATEFLTELASSGCRTLYIDSLDRVNDPGIQATLVDLIWAVAKVPAMRLVATVGSDFSDEQRAWLPAGALTILGHATTVIDTLTDDEVAGLAEADGRLRQLLNNPQAQPLARNLYQLRQLLGRAGQDLPLSEAALARSWWSSAPRLSATQNRARQKALRALAGQAMGQITELDISSIAAEDMQDLVEVEDVSEIFIGSKGVFRHDILRDWAVANLLIEKPDMLSALPLSVVAPVGLARAVEIMARWCAEQADGVDRWASLFALVNGNTVHGSWRRVVLLALVRTEPAIAVLDGLAAHLLANKGELLRSLIRITEAADSTSATDRLQAAGIDPSKLPDDLRIPTGPSWARLMGWLLTRVDQIRVPIGPDLLRFFRLWLMATGGRDAYSPLIVQALYDWLIGLERQDRDGAASPFSVLFAYDGRFGRRHQLGRDIRSLFLIFCGSRPDLAETYLRDHLQDPDGVDVADEVLQLSHALAGAAPAVMADFTIDALIVAEERYVDDHGPGPMGRLSYRNQEQLAPSPSKGPYLAVLRASAADGLRLVRRIVNYGLHLDGGVREGVQRFEIELQGVARTIAVPAAYFVARSPGENAVMASALRAMEAWAHERVERGEAVEDVVADVLGRDESVVPAPVLAVAVDVLLSHLTGPDRRLIPYIGSAELLRLDWDRYNRDRTGVHNLRYDDDEQSGPGTNADLWARPSRQTCLQWQASSFLVAGDPEVLAELSARLRRERDRFDGDADNGPNSLPWTVDHVLRLLDPVNWRQERVQLDDGSFGTTSEYIEPDVEVSILAPLRTSAESNLSEMVTMSHAVEAVIDPSKASAELLERCLLWSRSQDTAELREDENDFTVSQRWRAVVATAVMALRADNDPETAAWAADIVARAISEDSPDVGSFAMAQVRYSSPGLAVLGLARLAIKGRQDALRRLLEAATRTSPPVVAAFGLVLDDLATWRPELPAALMRLAIDASTMVTRDWDDPERFEALKARRADRLSVRLAEEEQFLLNGGSEPTWPTPAKIRYLNKRRRLSNTCLEAEQAQGIRERVLDHFNEQLSGAWLTMFEASYWVRRSDLPTRITAIYREFSNYLWGAGLDAAAEISRLPTAWLMPFARLRLRATCGLPWEDFKSSFLDDLVGLPDQGFLEAVEAVVPLADGLALLNDSPSIGALVAMRKMFCERLKVCNVWQWRRGEVGDTMARQVAGAVRALFVHSPFWTAAMESRLPEDAASFAAIFPALADLAIEAPGSEYVATLMMNNFERAQAWAPADLLVDVAEAWLRARPESTMFWRDHGFGGRVCNWLAGRMDGGGAAGSGFAVRVLALADRLAHLGVPEALALEANLMAN